jgi:hypothetical protein
MLANHEEEAHRQVRSDIRSAAVRAGWHRAQHRLPQRRQAAFTTKPGRDVDPEDNGAAEVGINAQRYCRFAGARTHKYVVREVSEADEIKSVLVILSKVKNCKFVRYTI